MKPDPKADEAWTKGWWAEMAGDLDEAVRHYQASIAAGRRRDALDLGRVRFGQKRLDEAEVVLNSYLSWARTGASPTDREGGDLTHTPRFLLAEIALRRGQLTHAQKILQQLKEEKCYDAKVRLRHLPDDARPFEEGDVAKVLRAVFANDDWLAATAQAARVRSDQADVDLQVVVWSVANGAKSVGQVLEGTLALRHTPRWRLELYLEAARAHVTAIARFASARLPNEGLVSLFQPELLATETLWTIDDFRGALASEDYRRHAPRQ